MYAARALTALLLAWPFARLLADPLLPLPRGERALFDEGAIYLVEAVRLSRSQLTSMAEGSLALWLLALYAGIVPLAGLLAVLTADGWSTTTVSRRAWRALGPLSLLLGASLVAGVLAVLFPEAAFALLEGKIDERTSDVAHDLIHIGARAASATAMIVVLVLQDVARAALLRDDRGALAAAASAWAAFRVRWAALLVAWAVRAVVGALIVLLVALATSRMGVENDRAFAVVLLQHQLVIVALVWLRADWLTQAVRSLGPPQHTFTSPDDLDHPPP